MVWVAVDKDGRECIYQFRPKIRNNQFMEKPRDFDPFGQTGLPPLATI